MALVTTCHAQQESLSRYNNDAFKPFFHRLRDTLLESLRTRSIFHFQSQEFTKTNAAFPPNSKAKRSFKRCDVTHLQQDFTKVAFPNVNCTFTVMEKKLRLCQQDSTGTIQLTALGVDLHLREPEGPPTQPCPCVRNRHETARAMTPRSHRSWSLHRNPIVFVPPVSGSKPTGLIKILWT